jgi:hypothetical protein
MPAGSLRYADCRVQDGGIAFQSGFPLTSGATSGSLSVWWSWGKKSGSGCGRDLETYPSARSTEGQAAKRLFFYTIEATNLLKTKDSTFRKRAKRTQNEPPRAQKNALLRGIDAGFCDFRGVGCWGLHEG